MKSGPLRCRLARGFVQFIDAVTDPTDDFQLIFKLSDGGIVTRAIRPPAGEPTLLWQV